MERHALNGRGAFDIGGAADSAYMADDDEIESWEESGLPFWKYGAR